MMSTRDRKGHSDNIVPLQLLMVSIQAGNPITGDAVVKSILAVLDPSPPLFLRVYIHLYFHGILL